jgi:hypothetical protein
VHDATVQVKDADTLAVSFVAHAAGKPRPDNHSLLKRQKAKK